MRRAATETAAPSAANHAARILLTDFDALPTADRNIARWLFLDPSTRTRYPRWEQVAAPTAAALRANHDPRVHDDTLDREAATAPHAERCPRILEWGLRRQRLSGIWSGWSIR
ncbi:MmyB family transcriptional regulator [Winogradskya humida]|uniref:MmyB-like transcription regulator ligand binding domain-containing protein n=1 Tax=Winogradskya humida TaxID=113566 RepID=A0ABQ4A3Q6_9ACTN|nr:hypothetical protein [Actinoplanes humidus]GIE25484.1 hypothetical protein Ahu01nite_085860 [Actinoplanes humidus]